MKRKDIVIIAIIVALALSLLVVLFLFNRKSDIETSYSEEKNEETEESKEVEWVEYPTDNWSVKYPSDWIANANNSSDLITFEEPLRGVDDNFREYFSVCYIGSIEDIGTLDNYISNTLLPAINQDPSCLSYDPVENMRLETDESVNKVYSNARQIRLRCKMMSIDYQNAYKSDPTTTNQQVSDTDSVVETEVAQVEEEPSENDSMVDDLKPNGSTLYRTYTIIENGGNIYAFISSVSDLKVNDYTEVFDKALKSLNCLLGESEVLNTERAKNITQVNTDVEETAEVIEEEGTEEDYVEPANEE